MRNLPIVFILFLLLPACSSTKVVLLPDSKGNVGRVEVSTNTGTVTLDQANQGVSVSSPDEAPGKVTTWDDNEIQRTFGKALSVEPPIPARYLLYFLPDSTKLTEESAATVPEILQEIQGRGSTDISINGHTDRVGDEEYNIDLSLRRAMAIFETLEKLGIQDDHMTVTSHGEGNPLVPTPDGFSEPRNRRVEVVIR